MSPDFLPGDFIFTYRKPWQGWLIGDDVVVKHPKYGVMIKRISDKDENGFRFSGIHPKSLSSEDIGVLPTHAILGKVFWHIKQ